jgi:hypothetical protein
VREREGLLSRSQAALLQLQRLTAAGGHVRQALAFVCLLAACATKQAPMTVTPAQPTQAQTAETPMMPQDSHADIDRLSKAIDADREKLALPMPPVPSCAPQCTATPMAAAVTSKDCHPGQSDTCQQTCTLSDAICDNAQHICTLAAQLPGDSWAAEKCDAGKSTCDAAHAKCCACTP